ncbi:MAG: 4-oxalocrotonate tautomerase family protein [Candidatus Bathyarchaeia archaeon]
MPLVEIKLGEGSLPSEQLQRLGKDVTDQINRTYQDLRGRRPSHVWVVIQEVPAKNWLLEGATLEELRNRKR